MSPWILLQAEHPQLSPQWRGFTPQGISVASSGLAPAAPHFLCAGAQSWQSAPSGNVSWWEWLSPCPPTPIPEPTPGMENPGGSSSSGLGLWQLHRPSSCSCPCLHPQCFPWHCGHRASQGRGQPQSCGTQGQPRGSLRVTHTWPRGWNGDSSNTTGAGEGFTEINKRGSRVES